MKPHVQPFTHTRVTRGYSVLFLCLIALTQSCKVMAETFVRTPMNITAPVGNTVQFNCTAEGVMALTYLVNSMTIAEVASIGVFQITVNDGSQINAYLHVPVTNVINNWPVVAIAFLPDKTRVYSPPAYLHVQAPPSTPPSTPQNLTAITGATNVFLTWSQPNDTGLGGVLSYKVSYRDINGTLFNMVNCTILSHNVTDLTPNTTYTMTVMADNGISGNEENRSVSVNVTTNAIDVAIYNTIDPNTTTDTSPAVVTLVVALVAMWCMVGVMIVVLVVVGLVVMKKRKPNMIHHKGYL